MFVAVDSLVIALRALSFIAIFQAAGNAMFLAMFRAQISADAEQRLRTHARIAAAAALLLAVIHYVLTPARMAGSLGATFDPALEALVLESSAGGAHIARVIGLALLLLSLDRASKLNSIAMLAGVSLTLVSFVLMGHTAIHPLRWALAPLLLVHVVAAAFWFGALLPLAVVAAAPEAGAIVGRFAVTARRAVPALFLCGAVLAALMIRSVAEVATPYGASIAAKALAFGVLVALASVHKTRSASALVEAGPDGARAFKRAVALEWAILALVLAGTAVLTMLLAPEHLEGAFGPGHEPLPGHAEPLAGPVPTSR